MNLKRSVSRREAILILIIWSFLALEIAIVVIYGPIPKRIVDKALYVILWLLTTIIVVFTIYAVYVLTLWPTMVVLKYTERKIYERYGKRISRPIKALIGIAAYGLVLLVCYFVLWLLFRFALS